LLKVAKSSRDRPNIMVQLVVLRHQCRKAETQANMTVTTYIWCSWPWTGLLYWQCAQKKSEC